MASTRACGLGMAELMESVAVRLCLGRAPEGPQLLVKRLPLGGWIMAELQPKCLVITVPTVGGVSFCCRNDPVLVHDHPCGLVGEKMSHCQEVMQPAPDPSFQVCDLKWGLTLLLEELLVLQLGWKPCPSTATTVQGPDGRGDSRQSVSKSGGWEEVRQVDKLTSPDPLQGRTCQGLATGC